MAKKQKVDPETKEVKERKKPRTAEGLAAYHAEETKKYRLLALRERGIVALFSFTELGAMESAVIYLEMAAPTKDEEEVTPIPSTGS